VIINYNSVKHFHLGKVGVVKDVAGKSRIIGITNYWIQVALEPLHSAILSFLKDLETDGTFDQLKPIYRLAGSKESWSSLDLSAATDRLPLDFQRDVISSFTNEYTGNLWSNLMKFDLWTSSYSRYCDRMTRLSYSVGQPMGAYSSWASLALSHHMIVQMSSSNFTNKYAILGDDIVIVDSLRNRYLELIRSLGVEIQETKSLINDDSFVEFAKRLVDIKSRTWVDYSIIGPKLIIGSIKNPIYKINILIELMRKRVTNYFVVRNRLSTLPGKNAKYCKTLGLSALSITGNTTYLRVGTALDSGVSDLLSMGNVKPALIKQKDVIPDDKESTSLYVLYWTYYKLVIRKYRDIYLEALASIIKLFLSFNKPGLRGFISHILLFLSPYFWILVRNNIIIAWQAFVILFDHYQLLFDLDRFDSVKEFSKKFHPSFSADKAENIEAVKADLSAIKRVYSTFVEVHNFIVEKNSFVTLSRFAMAQQLYKDVMPWLFNDKG
jgi:hypothetical protein